MESALLPRSRVLLPPGPDTAARAVGPDRCVSGRHRRKFAAARNDGAFGGCRDQECAVRRMEDLAFVVGGWRCPADSGALAYASSPAARGCLLANVVTRIALRGRIALPPSPACGHQRCERIAAVSPCFDAARRLLHDSELVDVDRGQKLHRGVAPTSEVVLCQLRVRAACQSRPGASGPPLPAACAGKKWMPVWRKRLGTRL